MKNMLTLNTRGDNVLQLINKYKVILIIFVILIGNSIYGLVNKSEPIQLTGEENIIENAHEGTPDEEVRLEDSPKEQTLINIPVYICGEIQNPGVYWVRQDILLDDLIKQAGGFTEDADQFQVNLAGQITSNEKIYIPKRGEQIDKSLDSYDNSSTSLDKEGKININKADHTTLEELPGIGSVKANQIIQYRDTYGPFETVEQLKDVSGIGEKTYSLVEGLISAE